LKGGTIDIIYTGESSLKVQFHPKQGLFANSDSVEEGVRQLINNYIHYVYTQIDEYAQLVLTTLASIAIKEYFFFIEEQLKANSIGRDKDVWSLAFPLTSSRLIAWLSHNYYIPPYGTNAENEKFMQGQLAFHAEQRPVLESQRRSLFVAIGLN
jgi:hypothetical protein